MAVRFEMVNNSAADDAVDEAKDFGWLKQGIGNRMQMVKHDYVGIDGKATGLSGFSEGVAGYNFEGISAKDRKAVLRHGCDVKSRIVSRNGMHEA